jgi:hypothetical protein
MMKCPICERPTTPRRGKDGQRIPHQPGEVQATLADGTCFACYNKIRGWIRPRRSKGELVNVPQQEYLPPRFTSAELEDLDVAATKRWVDSYVSKRRTRGIHPLGMSVTKLKSEGAHLEDVK